MHGGCVCGNIRVEWGANDFSVTPRACQCGYCVAKNAAYVSRSGSIFRATIFDGAAHRVLGHGTHSAEFHECSRCDSLVFVTAHIDNTIYGVLNSKCFSDGTNFPPPQKISFDDETLEQRRGRWRNNWCYPVFVSVCKAQ
jgi:hypothetical protein